jgi:hypothetical protein
MEGNMPSYSPELIQTMRAALDEVMTKVPLEQATPGIKAALAEHILKTAAQGQTSRCSPGRRRGHAQEADGPQLPRLLRARGERPRSRRAA